MNLQDTAAELVNQGKLPLSAFLRMLNSGKFSSKIENMKKENPWYKVPERKNILKHTKRENPWRVMVEGECTSKVVTSHSDYFGINKFDKDWLPKRESDLEYFIRTSILRNSARKKLGWLDG